MATVTYSVLKAAQKNTYKQNKFLILLHVILRFNCFSVSTDTVLSNYGVLRGVVSSTGVTSVGFCPKDRIVDIFVVRFYT